MAWNRAGYAAAFVVVTVALMLVQNQSAQPAADRSDSTAVRLREEAEMIESAKRRAAARMKDPASAQFGPVYVKGNLVCGEINGRNSLGAYAGMQRFVAMGSLVYVEGDIKGMTAEESQLPVEMLTNCLLP